MEIFFLSPVCLFQRANLFQSCFSDDIAAELFVFFYIDLPAYKHVYLVVSYNVIIEFAPFFVNKCWVLERKG